MTETNTNPPEAPAAGPAAGVVQQYVAFWNAQTGQEQQALAAATFADGVSYHAPVGVLHGIGELIGFRDQFAQHSPDYVFQPRAWPEAHHDRARLQWELTIGGASFAEGTDVLELDEAGHIASITSFLDRAPEGFARAEH